jgi:hypothetical protein
MKFNNLKLYLGDQAYSQLYILVVYMLAIRCAKKVICYSNPITFKMVFSALFEKDVKIFHIDMGNIPRFEGQKYWSGC